VSRDGSVIIASGDTAVPSEYLLVRTRVFAEEWGWGGFATAGDGTLLPDEFDRVSRLFWIKGDGGPIGIARLTRTNLGFPYRELFRLHTPGCRGTRSEQVAVVTSVAVLLAERGQGWGGQLMEAVHRDAVLLGVKTLLLTAVASESAEFFCKLGYRRLSHSFESEKSQGKRVLNMGRTV